MFNSTTKKRIQALGILFLIIGTFSTYFNLFHTNLTSNSTSSNEEIDKKSYIYDNEFDNLETADYSDNYSNTGGSINTKLHQSYTNLSNIYFSDLETTNSFNADCPTDTTFNSSLINVAVKNINAPNQSFVIENVVTIIVLEPVNDHFVSITPRGYGYIENISLYVNRTTTNPTTLNIYLYNALNSSGQPRPDSLLTQIVSSTITGNNPYWLNLTNIHTLFNCSETFQDTFFLQFEKVGGSTEIEMFGYYDFLGTDDEIVLNSGGGLHLPGGQSVDVGLKIDYAPLNNTPSPSQIIMKINGSELTDNPNGLNEGFWLNENEYSSSSGQLDFELSAEWWDVSCNVTAIQINYTKTDLKAISTFNIPGSGQSINWNSTLGAINDFDATFSDYRINFTISATWENFTASDGSTDKTSDITLGPIINNYRDLQISNAGNGVNWYITAQSENLLGNVHTYVNIFELSTVDFTDVVSFLANFSETITDGAINLSVYSPDPGYNLRHNYFNNSLDPNIELSLGSWTISENATEYGQYKIQVTWHNDTAGGFFEKDLTIMAVTDLVLISPPIDQNRFLDEIFNITVFYNDTGKNSGDQGIVGANIAVNDTYIAWVDESNGNYNIEVNSSDYGYGWNYIRIDADDTYYNLDSITFSFHLRMKTNITPSDTKDFGDVIKGTIVQYEFNYSDVSGTPIVGATPDIVQLDPSFLPGSSITENGGEPGNYTIQLDTSNVQASSIVYECIFNITAIGKETKNITVYITIVISQTEIKIISYDNSIIRKDGLNQSVFFFFNDTDNDWGIPDLPLSNVSVIDNQTGLPRPIGLFSNGTDGFYTLNISVTDLESGWIQLMINITFEPNYNTSLTYVYFYLWGNLTQTQIISFSDLGGEGTLTGIGNEYSCFIGRDLNIDFNITDTDHNNTLVTGAVNSYLVEFIEIGNSSNLGSLPESLTPAASSYQGQIDTSNLPRLGSYTITIKVFKTNFETSILSFNLTLRALYLINISVVDKPIQITAGASFNITIKVEYFNGSNWVVVDGANVEITPYFDAWQPGTATGLLPTNSTGEVEFEIFSRSDARNMTLIIDVQGAYYHVGDTLEVSDITVNAPPTGFNFEDLIPYLIIIGAAVAVIGGSVAIYRGVVVPKKREKSRVLTEVKTIFDDAINLEHVLVLYKGSGTCVYFKSFGSEQIDPELISGFISAISSFGKDLVSQEELNEISYGDKMLLLSDGEHIRVALVLSKKASLILRRNLMEFIHKFERSYENELPNWRGQLNIFRGAGTIVDEILSTSIILPHEITYDYSTVKALKKSQSRDVLKIANNLMKDSERNFFFIATLLKEATEKTGKDTAEIFMGIKELRDIKILMPIEISAIEAKPISQQELNLINQKVSSLVSLSPEERQKLVNDLSQIGPAEREAYFVSLAERHAIVSAPIESKIGAAVIDTIKGAKKEIKSLKKNALTAKKEKDYDKSIKIFHNAVKIATNWELAKESQELDDIIRMTKIEDLRSKMKTLEKEAKLAAKEEKYNEAAQKYKISSKIASEIFKLGVTEMTKEVKRLSNKSKEYEKLV